MESNLQSLLDSLRRCPPSERIELREPILAYGTAAVVALRDLATDHPDLAASVAAWLENLAKRDAKVRPAVIAALKSLSTGVEPTTKDPVQKSLDRLGIPPSGSKSVGHSQSIPRAAGTDWPGFQAHEFGRNVGTHWRSANGRESLAPIITRALREQDSDFMSFGVERSPEIHFAVSRRYKGDETSGFTASKLVVYAHGPTEEAPQSPRQVAAGWYIERGDGLEPYGSPDNALRWDWPLFLRAVARPAFQVTLGETMRRHSLAMGDYAVGRFKETLGWIARIEGDEPVARDYGGAIAATGWGEILESLVATAPESWIDLHIVRTWPADEAISAGQPFAVRELAPVLNDLAVLYLRQFD